MPFIDDDDVVRSAGDGNSIHRFLQLNFPRAREEFEASSIVHEQQFACRFTECASLFESCWKFFFFFGKKFILL